MKRDSIEKIALVVLFVGIVAFYFLGNGCLSQTEKAREGEENRTQATFVPPPC